MLIDNHPNNSHCKFSSDYKGWSKEDLQQLYDIFVNEKTI